MENIPYHFKCLNPSDYEVTLFIKINSRMLNYIFTKAKEQLKKKQNITVTGNPDAIKKFPVPIEQLKLIKTIMHKTLRNIEQEVKKDGISVISMEPLNGMFEKNNTEEWLVHLTMGGTYADKR